MVRFGVLALATWAGLAAAKDVYLNWNVTWVNAAPDGFMRPVIGINHKWPCPQIDVNVGDRLIIDVYNGLGNESTGIHWHGFRQSSTGVMDGAVGVTQCPLAPGSHMQYHFDVEQAGTYWYHSHNMGQYPDGFRGALIVHDPNAPFQYDEELTITLSDWYHQEMPGLLNTFQSKVTPNGPRGEPLPDSALINDATNTKIKVLPNKTYLVHIICTGNWPGHTWVFDGHEMTVVEVDGVYVEPYPAGERFLRIATGQRMSVLIKTKPDASKNFAIWDTMDVNMMFFYENRTIPAGYNPNATAWLVYDESKPLPAPPVFGTDFDFVDDLDFVPIDREPLLQPVNHQIVLDTGNALINGVPRFTVNNQTYIAPKVPSLYTANTVGPEFASNPAVYGQVNPFVVKHGDIVEIVINNHHNNLHPWHLHGHQFQVLQRTDVDGGYYTGLGSKVSTTPVRRDTIMVQNHGHAVLRFRADNPGVWMLHCHVEWHVEAGLMATIIEAPETFADTLKAPPKSHYDACASFPQPVSGNAAGKQGLDLTGLDTQVTPGSHGALYYGNKHSPANTPLAQAPPAPKPSSKAPAPAPKPTTKAPAPKPVHTQKPASHAPVPQPEQSHAPVPASAPGAPALPSEPEYNPKPDYHYSHPKHEHHESTYINKVNTGGSWPPVHIDGSNIRIDNPNKPHDHHLTIHEELIHGPSPSEDADNGYVLDEHHG
ncbi:Multicopper oxidase type 2 [Penicillium bovifimosum]|uniref:Multicopper oxidase type 2 n=1 Tax=Penicillium bovifimosum TaxID=126998 RepID=A0A9W9HFT2_9EURO|nr:Multicopper oxidase type 2 [Penicillium bovifimosum]KAJ5146391.1 Multicopper oxidase type 2 [Penicillium bovifimosum]